MSKYIHPLTSSDIRYRFDNLNERTTKPLTNLTIILDLDATLISTMDPRFYNELTENLEDIGYLLGDDNVYNFELDGERIIGVIRPDTVKFLNFCDRYFNKVIVYTAGAYDYGHAIVSEIFSKTEKQYMPDYVLTRPECLFLDDPIIPILGVRKPLALVIPDYDATKCLLLDDRISNIRFNPRNGIIIPPFNPTTVNEALSDKALDTLEKWFKLPKVKNIDDVRNLEKMMIFSDLDNDLEDDFF